MNTWMRSKLGKAALIMPPYNFMTTCWALSCCKRSSFSCDHGLELCQICLQKHCKGCNSDLYELPGDDTGCCSYFEGVFAFVFVPAVAVPGLRICSKWDHNVMLSNLSGEESGSGVLYCFTAEITLIPGYPITSRSLPVLKHTF